MEILGLSSRIAGGEKQAQRNYVRTAYLFIPLTVAMIIWLFVSADQIEKTERAQRAQQRYQQSCPCSMSR